MLDNIGYKVDITPKVGSGSDTIDPLFYFQNHQLIKKVGRSEVVCHPPRHAREHTPKHIYKDIQRYILLIYIYRCMFFPARGG